MPAAGELKRLNDLLRITVVVNIFNCSRPIVAVTNNLIGLIFSRVGYRDLGISFSNKLGL